MEGQGALGQEMEQDRREQQTQPEAEVRSRIRSHQGKAQSSLRNHPPSGHFGINRDHFIHVP